jgi:hypothetical protein
MDLVEGIGGNPGGGELRRSGEGRGSSAGTVETEEKEGVVGGGAS